MLKAIVTIGLFGLTGVAMAHGPVRAAPDADRAIQFPDTKTHRTLVLDLHTHSVFSDGHVWPTVRVGEAVKDGLDGMAITEHLEFQPHISDIPHPDRNRAFEEARRAAQGTDVTVIPGVEITRLGDPGHINAVFVKDANVLVEQRPEQTVMQEHKFASREEAEAFAVESAGASYRGAHQIGDAWVPYADTPTYLNLVNFGYASAAVDPRKAVQGANDQGAFVFWNHPSFASVGAELNAFHASVVKDGLLHGVEIANGDRYYENAHRLALKHDLALIGVSDVHELIAWDYRPDAGDNPGHRPVTLVLANEDSLAGMREALFARRTVVWWKDTLIGRPSELQPLLESMVHVKEAVVEWWGLKVVLRNNSDAALTLRNETGHPMVRNTQLLELPAHGDTEVSLAMDKPAKLDLKFAVLNALVAPSEPAELVVPVR